MEAVARRGPDHENLYQWTYPSIPTRTQLQLFASVLHLRGKETVRQPIRAPVLTEGDQFCWNGEVFGGSIKVHESDGDTLAVAHAIAERLQECGDHAEKALLSVLNAIQGPYALFYYHHRTGRVYFGRDPMGRRSLLVRKMEGEFWISSVAVWGNHGWLEVSPGLHCVDLNQPTLEVQALPQDPQKLSPFYRTKVTDRCLDPVQFPNLLTSQGDLSPQQLLSLFPQILPPALTTCVSQFRAILQSAVDRRVLHIPKSTPETCAPVAILFSGGLDCTILAALVDQSLPKNIPIDLLNVSFENPRVLKARRKVSKNNAGGPESDIYSVPDRVTGRSSLEMLHELSPLRTWNFVEVNVSFVEYQHYAGRILDCMYPHQTVMDYSIASAFWFAARGVGSLRTVDPDGNCTQVEYRSKARVLLSGLGADELFGGYSHHRSAYLSAASHQEAVSLLRDALQRDVDRLHTRNLGRDDRLFSDHGKEVRFPFLEEQVVEFATENVPLSWKCIFRSTTTAQESGAEVPRGIGDKFFLRCLAQMLGLGAVSVEKKRAVQFGAKTAKMQQQEHGEDVIPYDVTSPFK